MKDEHKTKEDLAVELRACRERVKELERILGAKPAGREPDFPKRGGFASGAILVVDDEPDLREMAVRMLESYGFRVLETEDAERALALVRDAEAGIDLVLTDVMMPGMGGVELARRMVEEKPGLKILFMTGFAEGPIVPDEVYGVLTAEAGLIEKPFTAAVLVERIREKLGT